MMSESEKREFREAMEGKLSDKSPKKMSSGGYMSSGGTVCKACGYSDGGEVKADEDDDNEGEKIVPSNLDEAETNPEQEHKRWLFALLDRRGL